MGSPRLKNKKIALVVGGQDYWADGTAVTIDNEEAESDVTTFEDALAGGARQHFINLTAIQSTATGSFWRFIHANTGEKVQFKYAPHGNEVPTANEPHFIGTATIGAKPPIGGEAGTESTFEHRMDIDGEPVLDDGSSGEPIITAFGSETASETDRLVIYGMRFTGVTGVTFDSDPATEVIDVSDGVILAEVPELPLGAVSVVVTNAAGNSRPMEITIV